MKKFSAQFAFILSLILHVQSMAWATGSQTLEGKALVAKIVGHYNSLNQEGKIAEMSKMMDSRPESDRDFLKKSLGDWKKVSFPELKQSENSIVFIWDKQDVVLTPVKGYLFTVNGHEVDFALGKFSELEQHSEFIFVDKTVSIFDLLIPSAHAKTSTAVKILLGVLGIVAVLVGFIVAASATAFVALTFLGSLTSIFSFASLAAGSSIEVNCRKGREKLDELKSNSSTAEIFKVKQAIMRGKSELLAQPECVNGTEKVDCKNVLRCLSSLEEELNLYLNAVNTDARDKIKEMKSPASTPNTKKATAKEF
jgi:hypothetical protein